MIFKHTVLILSTRTTVVRFNQTLQTDRKTERQIDRQREERIARERQSDRNGGWVVLCQLVGHRWRGEWEVGAIIGDIGDIGPYILD
jgi:hypothetical protein